TDEAGLFLEKGVRAVGGEENEETPVADVLHARPSRPLPPGSRPLREPDAVTADELLVDPERVLPLRDGAGHVEPVPLTNVRNRELLNEPAHGSCHTAIRHYSSR